MNYKFSDGIYYLQEDMVFRLKFRGRNITIRPHKDFGWNGVTGFWEAKNTFLPSMIHDFLLYDMRINDNDRFTRKEIDEIFIIVCKICNVNVFKRMFFASMLKISRIKHKLMV